MSTPTQARADRNRLLWMIVGGAVIVGALVAAIAWYATGSSSTTTVADTSSVDVTAGDASVLVGSADAPVKIVIYEDFQCPVCADLENETRDYLHQNAAQDKVQVEYQPVNLLTGYPYSAQALDAWGAVLKNASPQAALKLHDLLFENQPAEATTSPVTAADLAALVKKADGSNAEVTSALAAPNTEFLAAAHQQMMDKAVASTPTVYIDGTRAAGQDVAQLVTAIENAVSGTTSP
ncbi:MAG TPA: thioredoxin domain-containing protein [Marmoricola sp.]|nr:thioredoxin domain-containing protein [Marmoricola sp.]